MRIFFRTLGLLGACLLSLGGTALGQETPAYANVQIVSMDPVTRLVVIKNTKGANETLELDDAVAASGVKSGDRVILTVRGEPGRKRVSAISKVTASPVPSTVVVASPTPLAAATAADRVRLEMRDRFAAQVATQAQQARAVDAVWGSFVTSCDVQPVAGAEGSREWFGLWDGRVKADLSSGFCRDLFNQIVSSGEGIKKAMASAEDVARKTLGVEEVRDIRRLNSMDWDGWPLSPPDKLEP